jgi:hypothetical protein
MRLGRALTLGALAALLACRRAPPSGGAEAPAAPPAAQVVAAPLPPPTPAVTTAPALPTAPAPAGVDGAPRAEPTGALGVAPLPATLPAAPTEPSQARPGEDPAKKAEEEDATIYSWEDASGVVHFGTRAEIPADRRHLRKASGAVSILPQEAIGEVPQAEPAAPAGPAVPPPGAVAREPGDEPALDADGLPIPGTMKGTAHTRAVKAATGGVGVDPASAERAHQEELRRLKCRVVDGATICG